jgi:L-ascorbate metabolism protein UlaG (beta-lactamase superfamily)
MALSATCALVACSSVEHSASASRRQAPFENTRPIQLAGFTEKLSIFWDFMFNKPAGTVPDRAIAVRALSPQQLAAAPVGSLFRLGHSTVLMKLRAGWVLTDPMFSERASPVSWAGPQRFHAPPIALQDLPPLLAVILSHDHYDHLDQDSILALADRSDHFLAPLRVGERLIDWGVEASKVQELDWWQETQIKGLRLVATPAQHFSGRGMFDANQTLWASWVIIDGDIRLFFSGDTGYFDGFKRIGETYGPFDVTLIENGAYNTRWPDVHMQPEQVIQAHLDLRGRWLLPIHNGTFDLAMHTWTEPLERILALAEQRGVALTTPAMGEALNIRAPHAGQAWWRADAKAAAPSPRPVAHPQATAAAGDQTPG